MLVEKVKKFYNKEVYDLNCAETIVYAANEEYDMKLNGYSLKSAAAFGGGMAIEDMCGVVTGSLIILGMLFTKERSHESNRMKILSKEYITRFHTEFDTYNCKILKTNFKTDVDRCSKMLIAGALILDDMINRELEKQ